MSISIGSRVFSDVDALEKLVIHAATEYEINGFVEDFDGVEITDPEYDSLIRELKNKRPDSKAFEGTSPSEAQVDGGVVIHNPPMTSISKADGTEAEKKAIYEKWIESCAQRLGVPVDKISLAGSYKRDGVAIRINYKDGKLVSAGLRPRDGINGTDVTRHAANILGVPKNLSLPLTLSLNGEIECWFEDFDKINLEREQEGEDPYKNPRNYTAGCLGRDNASETKNAGLRIAFYSITGFDDWDQYYKTEVERAKWANSPDGLNLQDDDGKGFFVQTRVHKFEHLKMMEDHAVKLGYYTDGVVLKVNNLSFQEDLGHTGDDPVNEPRGALAWKYVEETAEATVSSIEWNASRTGRIVPTAIFNDPFVLADTDNTRATCNNYGWMEAQGLGPGAKVECKKGGKIIPNIMRVIDPVKDIGEPTECPTCNTKLRLNTSSSGNKDLLCENSDCAAKHIKGFIFYLQQLGCKGLGGSAVAQIVHHGKVRKLYDLYALEEQDLIDAGLSERQAILGLATIFKVKPLKDDDKLRAAIEKARNGKIPVQGWVFFSSLGISGAGKTAGKALVAHFQDFRKIMFAGEQDLLEVDGIGETTAANIVQYFNDHGDVAEQLIVHHLELEMPKTGRLSGTNFVLTGDFTEKKSHWEQKIQDLGGNIQSSVGSKTSYVVKEHSTGTSKEKKAIDKGVPVITVADLEKML